MSLYVAAYDVSSNAARERVARILDGYGQRVQWSVFLVCVDPDELIDLRRAIGPHLSRDDRFDLIPADERPNRPRLSWQRPPEAFDPVLVR